MSAKRLYVLVLFADAAAQENAQLAAPPRCAAIGSQEENNLVEAFRNGWIIWTKSFFVQPERLPVESLRLLVLEFLSAFYTLHPQGANFGKTLCLIFHVRYHN